MEYEVIMTKGNHSLIRRGSRLDEYAVVNGLCNTIKEWNYTVAYFSFGIYSSLTQAEALGKALDVFRLYTESRYISRSRLEELATLFKDGLILDDEESAMEYFTEECEMEGNELEFFGIETEMEVE